jgi:hypothetical protein
MASAGGGRRGPKYEFRKSLYILELQMLEEQAKLASRRTISQRKAIKLHSNISRILSKIRVKR